MRASSTIGKSDAAGVDDQTAIDNSRKWHVGVATHDRLDLRWQVTVHLGPSIKTAVYENYFLVVSRCVFVITPAPTRRFVFTAGD